MRLLLDACVARAVQAALAAAGHDALHVDDWWPEAPDTEVLACAFQERRILITLDKDFGELAIAHGRPHVGIVRLSGWTVRQQAIALLTVLERHGPDLLRGAIVTVEPGRVRIRLPE